MFIATYNVCSSYNCCNACCIQWYIWSSNGDNSYWATYKFKKEKFLTLTEYLHTQNYYTCADIVNRLVIPKQGFDEFNLHDELQDDLTAKHVGYIKRMKEKNEKGQNFFLYLQYLFQFQKSSFKFSLLSEIF